MPPKAKSAFTKDTTAKFGFEAEFAVMNHAMRGIQATAICDSATTPHEARNNFGLEYAYTFHRVQPLLR